MVMIKGAVDQVHAHAAEGFLLLHIFFVQHPHVNDDLAWLGQRLALKADTHPTVAIVAMAVTLGGHGVGEDKEFRAGAALGIQPLQQQIKFVFQHGL